MPAAVGLYLEQNVFPAGGRGDGDSGTNVDYLESAERILQAAVTIPNSLAMPSPFLN